MQNLHWWLMGGAVFGLLAMTLVAWRSRNRASLAIAVTALCLVLAGAATTLLWARDGAPSVGDGSTAGARSPAPGTGSPAPRPLTGLDGVVAPAGTCGAADPVPLDGPALKVFDGRETPKVGLVVGKTVRGDLDTDGADEIAVEITCRPVDGRMLLEHAYLFFGAEQGSPRFVGAVDARYQERTGLRRVGALDQVRISAAAVTATEFVWRKGDAECCPSGRAVSTWAVEDGVLVVRSTRECPDTGCP